MHLHCHEANTKTAHVEQPFWCRHSTFFLGINIDVYSIHFTGANLKYLPKNGGVVVYIRATPNFDPFLTWQSQCFLTAKYV